MNELERYLAEEIALDHADGHITRREALHRLGLMGIGATSAGALLAACEKPPTAGPTSAPASAAPVAPTSAAGGPAPESITFPGSDKNTLQGAWAAPARPRGAVLIIHENKGLTAHHRGLTGRFAAAGYAALAIDLLSEEGGTAALGEPANATAPLSKVPPARFVADMRSGLDELARRAPKVKLGAVGFCFGGGMTWRLIASKDERLAAAAPFYGPLPEGADFTGSHAAVLGIYAELDNRVNATRDAAEAALTKAGLTHEIVTFPGVDHAFFNDAGPRYNKDAAEKAWAKLLDWYGKYLG
ncbi:Dienelactone hydrolase family protein [Minicystis rosea]|nr:Dienelactone hydrolase family protein [Minicystis rosea]